MSWIPGRRKAQRALEDPFEDVPLHLAAPLWAWVQEALGDYEGSAVKLVAIDLRLALRRGYELVELGGKIAADPPLLLDVVEAILERLGNRSEPWVLAQLLADANSAYRIRDDGRGLELRVAPGVREAVREAVDESTGTSAGDHLIDAWNAAYGRTPDPVKAVSEAIKATEAALAAHVAPQNGRQTLGTMIRDVNAKPEKWTATLAGPTGVTAVLDMMRMLWEGQTSRHGGVQATRPETVEEARAAVHVAAALVQIGVSGAFRSV